MRTIKIIKENFSCHILGERPEPSYIYEGSETPYFSNDDETETVSIKNKEFKMLWNGFSSLNFNKIFLEANITGSDGWREGITLKNGFHETTIMLWCPEIADYSVTEQPESIKFLKLLKKIEKLADKYNFELNPTGFHSSPKMIKEQQQ